MHHTLFSRNVLTTTPVAGSRRARTSRAMRTYAAWFRQAVHPTPACRICPSPVDLAIPPCDQLWPQAAGPNEIIPVNDQADFPSPVDRIASIRQCLHGWLTELDHLPHSTSKPAPDRNRRDLRVCDIARTIDTAGYLNVIRAARAIGADTPESDRTTDQTATENLEAITGTFLSGARRSLSVLDLMLDEMEA